MLLLASWTFSPSTLTPVSVISSIDLLVQNLFDGGSHIHRAAFTFTTAYHLHDIRNTKSLIGRPLQCTYGDTEKCMYKTFYNCFNSPKWFGKKDKLDKPMQVMVPCSRANSSSTFCVGQTFGQQYRKQMQKA